MQEFRIEALSEAERTLLAKAKGVRKKAYAKYSDYKVGAAVMDEEGNIYVGCNIENIAYTGSHAERSAISMMFANSGKKKIVAIAVHNKDGGSPCGDCRQHIWEFCKGNPEIPILLGNESNPTKIKRTTIGELLPFAFSIVKR